MSTLDQLKEAAEGERLRALPGLGAKSEEKILKALAFKAENPDEGRRLLGAGLPGGKGGFLAAGSSQIGSKVIVCAPT